jgi:hypothetical protein
MDFDSSNTVHLWLKEAVGSIEPAASNLSDMAFGHPSRTDVLFGHDNGLRMLTSVDLVLCLVPMVTVSVTVYMPGFS